MNAPIIIEDNMWLASSVIVLGGVTIGKNSFVAAASIITKDIPMNSLVAGVPAKILREI
jgi:acetyltransferase-like isoleucine patch superfamily enzyme